MLPNRKTTNERLAFGSLTVGDVQRALIGPRAKLLTDRFDIGAVGTLTVSRRDGSDNVVDGRHRLHAALENGHATTKARCLVWHDLTVEEEAELFLVLNDSRQVSAIDRFKLGLIARRPENVAVDRILAEHNLRVAAGSSPGMVRCPDRLLAIYRKDDGELLRTVLTTIVNAFGTDPAGTEQVVLSGLAQVHGRYNGELDRPLLTRRLARFPGGAPGLIGKSRGLSGIRPISVTRAAAEIVVDTYNKGRSERLPAL